MSAPIATAANPAPRRRASWLKILVSLLAGLLVLLVVAYFVATSAFFLKSFVLPRVSKALNAQVTVADASLSPFHQVVLHQVKVQSTGPDPLLTAAEVRLRYSLMDILRKNYTVDELTILSPTITMVENPDGTSNLDPLLKSSSHEEGSKEGSSKPESKAEALKVDLKQLTISDGAVRHVRLYAGGKRDTAELSKFTFTAKDLRNGQTAKLDMSGNLLVDNNPPLPATNGSLQANLKGNLLIALSPDLAPGSIKGGMRLEVASATGAFAQAAGLATALDADVTPTAVAELALRFLKGSTPLGQVRASGPFDLQKKEGRLVVEVSGINQQLFNLASGSTGISFGNTSINSTNTLELSQAGKIITAGGQFNLNQLQVTRTNQTTPALDLAASYDLTVDTAKGTASIRGLTVTGVQNKNPFLRGELSSPMTISWGATSNAVGDSAFSLSLTRFNLADWRPFLPESLLSGVLNGQAKILSRQAGKDIGFDLSSQLENLGVLAGTNRITDLVAKLQATGTVNLQPTAAASSSTNQATSMNCKVTASSLQLTQKDRRLLSYDGSGSYQSNPQTADFQVGLKAELPNLLQLSPQPGMNFSAGVMQMNARITQSGAAQTVVGTLMLTNLTGTVGSNDFRGFATTADVDVSMTPEVIQIRRFAGKLSEGGKPGGGFDVTGNYGLSNHVTALNANVNLNQAGLRPFLEPALGGKQLVSVSLAGRTSVNYDPAKASSVQADLQVTNLVVNDPAHKFPATPLHTRLLMDAALRTNVVDMRQLQLSLAPTALATNQVNLTGQVDMSQSNATQGHLTLSADSLDVTTYYDLFMGTPSGASKTPEPAPSSPAPSTRSEPAQTQEPETNSLPFRNFVADAKIGRFYLHELQISNLIATVKLDGPKVTINPAQLTLNGAPAKATVELDLGIPGYKYDVDFSAVQVPLAPIVNSFEPEKKGQVNGTLTGVGKVSGTGTTGASLQKSLTGNFDIGTTNLNLAIPSLRSPLLKTIINVVGIVPELIKNPNAGLDSLAGALLGSTSSQAKGGWTDELMQSPIDIIQARGSMGSGRIDISDVMIQSPAFQAMAKGNVLLAPVLTNSTLDFPLSIAVKRNLAEKANLVPAGTPTNLVYIKLPDYVAITGTLGNPSRKINKAALLGTALQQLGGNIPGVDKKTANVLQNLGGALTGNRNAAGTNTPAGTNQSSGNLLQNLGGLLGGQNQGTNRPAQTSTNASPGALLQGLGSLLGGTRSTNAAAGGAATNQPVSTNQPGVGTLLDQLLGPKKK